MTPPPRQGGGDLPPPLGLGGEVDARRPVALQVDQPRGDDQAGDVEDGRAPGRGAAQRAPDPGELLPGGPVGLAPARHTDSGTLGPGTDRATVGVPTGPLPRRAGVDADVHDPPSPQEDVSPDGTSGVKTVPR